MGFDICDIGEMFRKYDIPRERNLLVLWYMLLKNLMKKSVSFVSKLSKIPAVMNGPAIFGALTTALRQKYTDVEFLEEIKRNFQDQWFTNAKYMDQTAHGYFMR